MPDRSHETLPIDAMDFAVELAKAEEEREAKKAEADRVRAERLVLIEQLRKEDTEASRKRIAEILKEWEPADGIPDEYKNLALIPNKREPIVAASTFGALKTGDKAVSVPKWFGYKGSALLVGIDNWGKNTIKKNAPWAGKVWFVGPWLLSDPKKSWEERDKEEAKKQAPIDKANKTALDKAVKDLEANDKKAKAALQTAETKEGKISESEKRNHEKMLQSFMTPLEEYDFKNGDEKKKEEILKVVQDDLSTREGKRKAREHESMLIQHMTPAEQDVFKAVIPPWPANDDPEKAEKIKQIQDMNKAKDVLQQKVAKELSIRTSIAETNKGGKGKKKGGGGGGKGRGRS